MATDTCTLTPAQTVCAPWEVDGVTSGCDYSSIAFLHVKPDYENSKDELWMETSEQEGILTVIEDERPEAARKGPGGHGNEGENPLLTVQREVAGETGLPPNVVKYTYLGSREMKDRGDGHTFFNCYFLGEVKYSDAIAAVNALCSKEARAKHPGNEGERPEFFTLDRFEKLVRERMFLRSHLGVMRQYGLTSL
jgi:8-oxo-dGTP pyrophosphatase MutT (NUDIX family)